MKRSCKAITIQIPLMPEYILRQEVAFPAREHVKKMNYGDFVNIGIDPKQGKQYFDVGIDDAKTKRPVGLSIPLAAICLPIKGCFPRNGENQENGTEGRCVLWSRPQAVKAVFLMMLLMLRIESYC